MKNKEEAEESEDIHDDMRYTMLEKTIEQQFQIINEDTLKRQR
jgi:hypothetical protein